MHWLDIILILVLALAAFIGYWRGLIRAFFMLAGLILGVFLAGRLYGPFANVLSFIPNDTAAKILAFIIILIAVLAAAMVIAFSLRKTIAAIRLGWADRLLGALFGVLLGGVICGAFLAFFGHFLNIGATLGQSWIASLLLDRIPVLLALLPQEFDAVRTFFQ